MVKDKKNGEWHARGHVCQNGGSSDDGSVGMLATCLLGVVARAAGAWCEWWRVCLWGVIGFAGAREDVDEQMAEASALGFSKKTDLGHDARFWQAAPAGVVPPTAKEV